MNDLMQHHGYYGSIHLDQENMIFHGKLEFIRALVTYEASDAKGLKKAFIEAVDDYLAMCEGENIEPEKPFKGSFNVRVKPELHRNLVLAAMRDGVKLNNYVEQALEQKLKASR